MNSCVPAFKAIKIMKKYGVQSQIRNDSDITHERIKYLRLTMDDEHLNDVRMMISGDLKPWRVYNLLKEGANFNAILMGTYLVNPYKLPGPAYKIAANQNDKSQSQMEYLCKVCVDEPSKATLPGPVDIYRVIGKDGLADRDVILLRGADSIDAFMNPSDQGKIKLNQQVMTRGEITYDLPDMCQLIESTAYHLGLFRPEHKRFRGAVEYPVIISPTLKTLQAEFARKFQKIS